MRYVVVEDGTLEDYEAGEELDEDHPYGDHELAFFVEDGVLEVHKDDDAGDPTGDDGDPDDGDDDGDSDDDDDDSDLDEEEA